MRRRDFLAAVGGMPAWSVAVLAQHDNRVRRVGVLMATSEADPVGQTRLGTFRQALADRGWIEGSNLRLDVRWAATSVDQEQRYARELVALGPEVILANGTPATQALRFATQSIPIVFGGLSDPIATRVVSNMTHPEGNVTGFMSWEYSLSGKWLRLLKDLAPRLARITLLFNPDTAPYAPLYETAAQRASEELALKVISASVRDVAFIEPAVASMEGGDGGLLVLPDAFNTLNRATTIALAAKYRVPAMYYTRIYPSSGGLMSYGPDQLLQFRDGATYVDRILRGAKPGDLPVQFATKFELVINLKAANALGLDVSQPLRFLADEVIE